LIPDGLEWIEAEKRAVAPLNAGLLSLCVIRKDLMPCLIGTAFIVSAGGNYATAISAAHCFEEIRKILRPNATSHPSTPPEFLSPPRKISFKSVKGIYLKDGVAHFCDVDIALWDRKSDLAVLTVLAPNEATGLFHDTFWIDSCIPDVGDLVVMIGFGEMETTPDNIKPGQGIIRRRVVGRVGRVEAMHPKGHSLLQAPCLETSIAIFGGMSGGFITRWTGVDTPIQPFALISHSPEPQPVYDQSVSGHSVGAILNTKITPTGHKKQMVSFLVDNMGELQVSQP